MDRRVAAAIVTTFLTFMSCSGHSGTVQFDVQISDLNGTWIEVKSSEIKRDEILRLPEVHDERFSWGIGKSIPNETYEVDVGKKTLLMPLVGFNDIMGVKKVGRSELSISVFSPDSLSAYYSLQNGVFRIDPKKLNGADLQQAMKRNTFSFVVDFLDADHMIIVHPNESQAFGGTVFDGDKLLLYRLSGPTLQTAGK